MFPPRLNLVLLSAFILGCCGYIRLQGNNQNAALAKKIAVANATLYKVIEKPFLVKTVRAIASMDPTVRDIIATFYETPVQVFECIQKNIQDELPASDKLSLSSYVQTLIKACPDYEASISSLQNATENLKKKKKKKKKKNLKSYSPEFIKALPPGVYSILSTASNFTVLFLNDFNSICNETYQKAVVIELFPLITNLSDGDRTSLANQVPWLAPFITQNGNYTASLQRTLDLVSSGVETSFNNSELAAALTNLTLGVSNEAIPILEWLYAKIDALPVSDDIQEDGTIIDAAITFANFAIKYGKPMLGSQWMTELYEVLLDGRLYFVDITPDY